MSSRTYNLWTRLGTGINPQSKQAPPNEAGPRATGTAPNPEANFAVRSYSDVVASCPPTPRRERPSLPSDGPMAGPNLTNVRSPSGDENPIGNSQEYSDYEEYNSTGEVKTLDKPEDARWTTVQCRCAHSYSPVRNKKSILTAEQTKAIRIAEKGLTKGQKQKIQQREEKVRPRRDESESSWGKGPSKPKGKGIDPWEWGNVNLSSESLDLGAQAAALNSFKKQAKATRLAKEKSHHRREKGQHPSKVSKKCSKPSERPAETQPAAQIASKSYLGAALRCRDNRHGRNRRHQWHSSTSGSKIKPIPPKEYDGSADVRAYHRFIWESDAYLQDGKVRGRRRVFLLSYYLTGKAYDF